MNESTPYTFMMDYVDGSFKNNPKIDSDTVANNFSAYIQKLPSDDFIEKLICTGYIPDIYANDSSEETLFTKLVEVMTAEWARRMGFQSEYIKQKASYQDVSITINNKNIVCDSKSFRLGRSQKAPNVKDFLKLADINKWLERYPEEKRLGGLVVYPCRHEWIKGSDAYQYCSTKSTPTLMLPYKYLAFLLKYSTLYNPKNLVQLWDYTKIFPSTLKNKTTNKREYWSAINEEIIKITKTNHSEMSSFMACSNQLIDNYIQTNIIFLQRVIDNIKKQKEEQLDNLGKEELKCRLLNLMIEADTRNISQSLTNIKKFRK